MSFILDVFPEYVTLGGLERDTGLFWQEIDF